MLLADPAAWGYSTKKMDSIIDAFETLKCGSADCKFSLLPILFAPYFDHNLCLVLRSDKVQDCMQTMSPNHASLDLLVL